MCLGGDNFGAEARAGATVGMGTAGAGVIVSGEVMAGVRVTET